MTEMKKYGKRFVSVRQGIIAGISFIMLCFSGVTGRAQQIDVEASFSRDTVLIGDQLDFTLRVVQPDSLKLNIPVFRDSITRGVEIVRTLRMDTVRKKNHLLEIIHRYRVIVFDTGGIVVMDPVVVGYIYHGMKATLASRPVKLVVKPIPIEPSKGPRDIKKPIKIPLIVYAFYFFFWFMVLQLVALGIYFLVAHVRKKSRKERLPEIMRKPAEPPHIFALRELNNLKDARLWQQGRVKEYYTRLTDILRKYLEYRYDIKALEQTSGETLHSLTAAGFNDNRLFGILKEVLETGDLVKFAKFQPQPDVNESVLLNAFVFVNETKESWKKEDQSIREEKKTETDLNDSEPDEEGVEVRDEKEKQEGKEEKDHA
ncbi:MAG: hypothetical protein J7K46_03900 [Bacteroidales bacterium]|nr:hypothetical protein [Bacteroidales bacterium]